MQHSSWEGGGSLVLTLNFLYFPLPWDASCPKILKISLKLYPFLYDETKNIWKSKSRQLQLTRFLHFRFCHNEALVWWGLIWSC